MAEAVKKDTLVLLICELSSLRQVYLEALKREGYSQVTYMTSGKDALRYLSRNPVNWIITTINIDAAMNGLALLESAMKEPKLRGVRISLIADSEQDNLYLPLAFELGAFSYFKKTFISDEAQEEIRNLGAYLESYKNNFTLTSAEYIRTFLQKAGLKTSLLAFEQNLLSLYPGNHRIIYCLAEAFFISGKVQKGSSLLEQLALLAPKMQPICEKLLKKYNADNVIQETNTPNNVLGVKNAAVIDPDGDVGQNIGELLRSIGVPHVECFDSSEKACEWLGTGSKKPDLIFMEWRQLGISGPALIQRLRVDLECNCPIIVASSLIKKEDFSLVREMGVSAIVKKPFESQELYESAIVAVQENRRPQQTAALMFKVRSLLKQEKFPEAEKAITEFAGNQLTLETAKIEILAEYCYAIGDFERAKDLAVKALKDNASNLNLINLLGKITLTLKDYRSALKLFEKADSLSPKNIERLFNMCDANLMTDNIEGAKKALETVKKIDKTNPALGEFEVKVALEERDEEKASEKFQELDSSENIISFMNSRAITLVRNSRYADAISLYETTVKSVPPKWEIIKSAIQYNTALAYIRFNQLENALMQLKNITEFLNDSLKRKVESLQFRCTSALIKNEPVTLTDRAEEAIPQSIVTAKQSSFINSIVDPDSLRRRSFEPTRGDICCYLIFSCVEGIDPKAKQLLLTFVKFHI